MQVPAQGEGESSNDVHHMCIIRLIRQKLLDQHTKSSRLHESTNHPEVDLILSKRGKTPNEAQNGPPVRFAEGGTELVPPMPERDTKETSCNYPSTLPKKKKKQVLQGLGSLDSQVSRKHFQAFARSEFTKYVVIEKRDFAAIEFLLRKGRRQLESYSAPGIKDVK
jgi:hypothetical protein